MANATYAQLQQRTNYLIGETSATTTAAVNSHLAFAIKDIVNAFPFSWDVATASLTLSAGTASLPADYNPKWFLKDARIAGSSQGDDSVFTLIPIEDRDNYSSSDNVWWVTYDTTLKRHIFNTLTQTGTVTIFYYFFPADLSLSTDTTIIPDAEALCLLAASKNWVTDERNVQLNQLYKAEATSRISALYASDLAFGPTYSEGSPVDFNSTLTFR